MRRVLCLYMPYFATDRARSSAPPHASASALDGPLVLTQRVGRSVWVQRVCSRAREQGVRTGITLGQAHALAPVLAALEHDPRDQAAALAQLADWALRFSPLVQTQHDDTLLLDISGSQRLFGSEQNLANQALGGLARRGYQARAAIADTVGAAYALASSGPQMLQIAPPEQSCAALAGLPPASLRLDDDTLRQLEMLGLRTIGDLLMLPRASLPARFGPQLVLRLQQALGEVHEGVCTHLPHAPTQVQLRFEAALHDRATLEAAAAELLRELLETIVCAGRALRQIDCALIHEHEPPTVLTINAARASRNQAHLLELLQRQFERLAGASSRPRRYTEPARSAAPARIRLHLGVCAMTLTATQTARYNPAQGDLFEPRDPRDNEAFGVLLDRLANRLGHEALRCARLEDDYQPEFAYRWLPYLEAGDRADADQSNLSAAIASAPHVVAENPLGLTGLSGVMARPMQLFNPPIAARVIALSPDGPPTWFALAGGLEWSVARAWGPERIETAWWRGPDVRRDYFRVLTEPGEQFWLFVDVATGRWHLHGVFC